MIAALYRDEFNLVGLSCDIGCPGFSSKYIKNKIHSPRLEDNTDTYVDFLLSLDIRGILIFSNDLCALTVSKHADRLRNSGFSLLIPEINKLESAFDKWDCYKIASKVGIKAPKSALVNSLQEAKEQWLDLRKPIIVKATRLAGGNYVKLSSLDDLEQAWSSINKANNDSPEHDSKVILQEWLEYDITDMWSCETVYTEDSQSLGFYSIQRIRSSLDRRTGQYTSRLFAGQHKKNKKLEDITEKLLNSIGWQGFAHVEYMYMADEDEYYLAEINPRLPGYSYFPSRAGFNMAGIYCDILLGNSPAKIEHFKPAVYFESLRYPGDISEGIYQLFKGNLNWRDFFSSYGLLFKRHTIKIIDPIRFDDLGFTLKSIWVDILDFTNYTKNWLFRKFKRSSS